MSKTSQWTMNGPQPADPKVISGCCRQRLSVGDYVYKMVPTSDPPKVTYYKPDKTRQFIINRLINTGNNLILDESGFPSAGSIVVLSDGSLKSVFEVWRVDLSFD